MPRTIDDNTLGNMPIDYRAIHGLLCTGIECLTRAEAIAKERSRDTAVIAEITASMALASAARAMVIAIHQARGTHNGERHALGLHQPKRPHAEPSIASA